MCNVKKRTSSRELFKKLSILPMPSVYIMEMVHYVKVNNSGLKQNMARYEHEIRHRFHFQTRFCRTDIF
jgi:hypothetical protein